MQHTDFGEKIGGARKDLWQERGLSTDDLAAMTEREAEKYVTKQNVWPVPDYGAMVQAGMPFSVAWFRKKVRDALLAKPKTLRGDDTPEKRLARLEQYVETAGEMRQLVENVQTPQDADKLMNRFFMDGGYVRADRSGLRTRYMMTEKGENNPAITNRLFRAVQVPTLSEFDAILTREARSKGFLQEKQKASRSSRPRKKRFVPPQLESVRRDGEDWRGGREMEGQNYLDTFGFRGGQYGNWLSQNDRQESLNMGFDALLDMAAALQISNRDIALDGQLAIAFGARGHGNAAAHYEPDRQVINLTKMKGAGSLAHEWWHALDDAIGSRLGFGTKSMTERPDAWDLSRRLYDVMHCTRGANGERTGLTEYFIHSQEMDGGFSKAGGYWSGSKEMAARAFACYVMDRLPGRSDYLVGHAEAAHTPAGDAAYPEGSERQAINAVFDEIIVRLKEDGFFTVRSEKDRPVWAAEKAAEEKADDPRPAQTERAAAARTEEAREPAAHARPEQEENMSPEKKPEKNPQAVSMAGAAALLLVAEDPAQHLAGFLRTAGQNPTLNTQLRALYADPANIPEGMTVRDLRPREAWRKAGLTVPKNAASVPGYTFDKAGGKVRLKHAEMIPAGEVPGAPPEPKGADLFAAMGVPEGDVDSLETALAQSFASMQELQTPDGICGTMAAASMVMFKYGLTPVRPMAALTGRLMEAGPESRALLRSAVDCADRQSADMQDVIDFTLQMQRRGRSITVPRITALMRSGRGQKAQAKDATARTDKRKEAAQRTR